MMRLSRWHWAIPLVAILLFAMVGQAFAQIDSANSSSDEVRGKLFGEILNPETPPDVRQHEILQLMELNARNYGFNSDVIFVFDILLRRDPRAIDPFLPRFAKLLHAQTDERDLWDELTTLRTPPELPAPVMSEIETIFRNAKSHPYAGPVAAAILLKAQPKRADVLKWFDAQLVSSSYHDRLSSAHALSFAGEIPAPTAAKLKALFKDSHSPIRVVAAEAYWRTTHDSKETVPVLREALAYDPIYLDLLPIYLSEDTGWTQTTEAVGCLGAMGSDATPAADDIAKLPLRSGSSDLGITYRCMHALVRIDAHSVTIHDTLTKLAGNKHEGIAEVARDTLALLRATDKAAAK